MEQRLERHNAGLTRSTRNRGPWDLVYKEEVQTRAEAVARERFFKTGAGREELKRRIQARP
jgi:putative endonuclease